MKLTLSSGSRLDQEGARKSLQWSDSSPKVEAPGQDAARFNPAPWKVSTREQRGRLRINAAQTSRSEVIIP